MRQLWLDSVKLQRVRLKRWKMIDRMLGSSLLQPTRSERPSKGSPWENGRKKAIRGRRSLWYLVRDTLWMMNKDRGEKYLPIPQTLFSGGARWIYAVHKIIFAFPYRNPAWVCSYLFFPRSDLAGSLVSVKLSKQTILRIYYSLRRNLCELANKLHSHIYIYSHVKAYRSYGFLNCGMACHVSHRAVRYAH